MAKGYSISFFRGLHKAEMSCAVPASQVVYDNLEELVSALPGDWFDDLGNVDRIVKFVDELFNARIDLIEKLKENAIEWVKQNFSNKYWLLAERLFESGGVFTDSVYSVYASEGTTRATARSISNSLYEKFRVKGVSIIDYLTDFSYVNENSVSEARYLASSLDVLVSRGGMVFNPSTSFVGWDIISTKLSGVSGCTDVNLLDCESEFTFLRGMYYPLFNELVNSLDAEKLSSILSFLGASRENASIFADWAVSGENFGFLKANLIRNKLNENTEVSNE